MKDFFKQVAATFVGLLIFSIISSIFIFIGLIGMSLSGSQSNTIKNNSVLVLNLSGSMNERVEDDFQAKITGQMTGQIGLDNLISGIRKAKNNDNIKGIYMEFGAFTADSYASMQAARNALEDFKKSGKWIVAYGDIYTQSNYYLASVADKIYLNPQGQIDWRGISAQRLFLKDLLAKFGVKMQVAKVGAYKSATEQFTGDKMSEADREQTTAYIGSIWKNILKEVSKARNLSTGKLNEYADSLITFAAAEDYLKMKLIDGTLYTDQIKNEIKKRLELKDSEDINQVSLADMADEPDDEAYSGDDQIAIYYAYGDIVDGAAGGFFSQKQNIDAQTVCKDLEKLKDDEKVKAVVFRINSGGGSAYASEQIWHYIVELRKAKPVVVSMGGMAASGGYYVSAPANWIIAEPTTITGSIGIFGMFPDVSGLLKEKLGVKFDEVGTNANSGFGTLSRPFNAEEIAYLERYIDRGYKLFRHRVAEGRGMTDQQVEKIAQGHVFSGEDALKIKLVDQLGGLDAAVKKAASLAKTKSIYTKSYPEPVNWLDQLLGEVRNESYLDDKLRAEFGTYYEAFSILKTINKQSAIQARLPYMLKIN